MTFFCRRLPIRPDDGQTYVRKSVLGREGASVAIVCADGTTRESASGSYDRQPQVFARYVEMPRCTARTPSGNVVLGHVLTTCFIVAGRPGAVGIRIGGEITDGRAHFAPVGYSS